MSNRIARYALPPEGDPAPADEPIEEPTAEDPAPEPQNVTEAIQAAGALSSHTEDPVTESEEAAEDLDTGDEGEPVEGEPTATDPEISDSDPSDPFAQYGGAETVAAAHRLYEATRTEDGLVQVFIEAGKQLGVGYDRIQALFEAGSTPADPDTSGVDTEDDDPDRPLTAREFQEYQQQIQQTETQKQQAAAAHAALETVKASVAELGVDWDADETTRDVILRLGDKYLQPGTTDPDAIRSAVQRGHADYQALVEKERQGYVQKKAEAASKVPKSPSGAAAPSAPAEKEPKDVAEAIKQARAMLAQS